MHKSESSTASDQSNLDLLGLSDFVPALIGVYNVLTNEYVYVNKTVKKILGYSAKEFLDGGVTFAASLIHPDDAPIIDKQNQLAIKKIQKTAQRAAKQPPIVSFEYRMRHKKGHYIWLQTDGSIYSWTPDGKIEHLINVSIDITERKQKEQELKELTTSLEKNIRDRTERLELALDASQMGIWERDFRTGAFNWSPRAKKLFGFKPDEEITQEKFINMIHPEDRHFFLSASANSKKSDLIEHRVIWPDGSIHWFLSQGKVIVENGVPVKVTGIGMNVDKLKKTQEALDASQQKYQAFIRNSNEAIWRCELDEPISIKLKPAEQVRLIYERAYLAEANEAMARMYGFRSVKPLIGMRLSELMVQDDPRNTEYLTQFIKSGYSLSGVDSHEKDSKGRDKFFRNSLVGTVENGKVVRAWGTQQDVTEQTRAQQELEESERRFRTMADSAPVFIWESGVDKLCTYFNKYWLEFTGRTLQQEIGNGWRESIHPDDVGNCIKTYEAAFDARRSFVQEYRLRRHDGTYHWILDTGVPRFSPDKTFTGYIGSCVDIEELKHTRQLEKATALLTQQRTELIELNKAKDEFISLASHQLRTPATGVKQYIGILLEGYVGSLADDQLHMLNIAYQSNERQLTIIDDLLRVAHLDAGQVVLRKAQVNVVGLVEDVLQEQAAVFKKRGQKTLLNSSHKKIHGLVDQDRLRMVVENIIDNASKYTEEGKTITISVEKQPGGVAIHVVDQGVGIAKKDIPRLFQKFSRIENPLSTNVGGTGLGLYWAKKIVDLHGGTIEVKPTPSQGTIFTISLPKTAQRN